MDEAVPLTNMSSVAAAGALSRPSMVLKTFSVPFRGLNTKHMQYIHIN